MSTVKASFTSLILTVAHLTLNPKPETSTDRSSYDYSGFLIVGVGVPKIPI